MSQQDFIDVQPVEVKEETNGKEKKAITLNGAKSAKTWGEREEIAALGKRLQVMMPGGEKMTPEQAMALAQYSKLADANVFRGEVYGYQDQWGKFVIVDGYKLLVRWAKGKADYVERYYQMSQEALAHEGVDTHAIGYKCFVLKKADVGIVREFTEMGYEPGEAFEIVATSATGVVLPTDTFSKKKNKKIPPPKGWTWHDVAKKRALKNALNKSHGAPSPSEIATESWNVNGQVTTHEDWLHSPDGASKKEQEFVAAAHAYARERVAELKEMSPEERDAEILEQVDLMRGKASDSFID